MSTRDSRSADIRVATVMSTFEDPDKGLSAMMVDSDTANSFPIPLSAPGGVRPVVGDTWLLTKEYGFWAFDRCIIMVSKVSNPDRTIKDILDALTDRGLISPNFGGGADPEAMHLAKIGQIRWFSYEPGAHWWPEADGSTVQRSMYRELGSKIAPGTSSTFDLPNVPILGDSTPYVCAR